MNNVTHDALSGNSPLCKAYVFVHSMWLINDSEQGSLLRDARSNCIYNDVISYSISRATFYRKLVQRKSAVP